MSRRLALCCAPQFLVALDFSVMAVAIAPLTGELGLSGERAALVLAAYSLPFGSLLVASGLLVDRLGPRRCLMAGFALFACGGLGVVGAQTGPAMLACRAIQGAGAAAIVPAGLALTVRVYEAAPDRRRALAWYAASISLGFVTGALVSGVASALWGWRAAAAVPVLVALAALGGCRLVRLDASLPAGPVRIAGVPAALATAAALAASCALCLATGGYGGAPAPAAAAAAAAAFGLAARRHRSSLLPRGLSRDRGFRLVVAGGAIVTATGVSGSLLLSLHLQTALGYGPIRTALVFAGFGLVALAGRRCTAVVGRRDGDVLGRGLALQGLGLAALAIALVVLPSPVALVLAATLFGLGHVVANAGVALGTAATPEASHGLAAALVASAQYVSGALGSLALVSNSSGTVRLGAVGVAALLAGVVLERRMAGLQLTNRVAERQRTLDRGVTMTQTKADRQEAAKKAAATRERNRTREESKERGTKAAATRQGNAAAASAEQAKQSVRSAGGGLKSAARSVGEAAKQAGKSVSTRSRAGNKR